MTPTRQDSDALGMRIARRTFLNHSFGLGSTAVALLARPSLLSAAPDERLSATPNVAGVSKDGILSRSLVAPRAKRVIFLCMAGGPSHLETFDYKPKLAEMSGKPMPESYTKGQPIAQLQNSRLRCQGPMVEFQRHGKSGQMISDYLPWTAKLADDMAIVKSMHTEQINHDPAHTFMNTGTAISGRPSMGAWSLYGLGNESSDLPGFVVMTSVKGRNPQPIATRQWHSGFLPSLYQGVQFNAAGDPVYYLSSPPGYDKSRQRDVVSAVTKLNRVRQGVVDNPEIATRIAQYEMAFRMQSSVPELMDISDEPQDVLDMYGTQGADGSFAGNCLLARRLAERGVRFIHLYSTLR